MGAGHNHDHGGGSSNKTRLTIALGVTISIVIAQAVGAVLTGSLALLVDTFHMLTDASGLAMALFAAHLMERPASNRHTWGLRRAEILSAMAQATLLFGVGVYALVEGVQRLFHPPEIASGSLLFFGILGLVANLISLGVLLSGRDSNLNMKAAFLEVANDALGSVAVIASAILIATLGWERADSVAAILISLLILPRTVMIVKTSVAVLMEATPKGVDLDEVRRHIIELPHVLDVYDLHVSLISTNLPVLTAHVVVRDSCFTDGHSAKMLVDLQQCVREHFEISIEHSTFQIEPASHPAREHVEHN